MNWKLYVIQQIYPGPFKGHIYAIGKVDDEVTWSVMREYPPKLFSDPAEAVAFMGAGSSHRYRVKPVVLLSDEEYQRMHIKSDMMDDTMRRLLSGREID